MPNCKQCNTDFTITDKDRQFYKQMQVPEPTLCPTCRQRRRLIYSNQINLYKRKCDGTGKDIITHYHPDVPLKVYHQDYWISDKVDNAEHGRDVDLNRSFFDQWFELAKAVPRPSLCGGLQFNENSDYVNYAGYNKNCYMIFDSDFNWDCYYSLGLNKSKNSSDCLRSKECELSYECVDCYRGYKLFYSQDCDNCSNSAFLKNCIGCKHCFMCSNLKNKEYFVFNKQYDKETYEKLMNSLSKHSELQKYFKDWNDFKVKYPQKHLHGFQNENVLGDYLVQSKDADHCFDSMELWDCKYFYRSFGSAKNCMDCDECGDGVELLYDGSINGFNVQNIRFSDYCLSQSSNLDYCQYCYYSNNCFGCIGLRRKKYCILNKQYSKEEYEELVPQIIERMKADGEWGEHLPAEYADYAYNETLAQEYYPLTKEEALSAGYRWREPDKKEYQPATAQVPDDSRSADASICSELLACKECGRNYKIVEQELKFYKDQGVPIPKKCFFCRHKDRFDLRNKRAIYNRKCDKCGRDIKTTYEPGSPWIVYCEKDYQDSLE
ncbi:zinc-ribbon domain containing protein [Candidatus Peregrinibacteria bacterium]|nr:zinc-ribbon domain containing protein [Candidatus Peregrinibacteria bacterium]